MSSIITSIILVGILNTSPLHVQFIDKLPSMDICTSVIAKIVESEKNDPIEERVGGRLACLTVSYRYNPDGDGPSKPTAPVRPNSSSMFKSGNTEDVPCKQKEGQLCRNASLSAQ